ncbi:ABC transporter ATP-binding protein [Enterococcus sp. JM4C]|uniref:ABC transporter ATP-binding protein n=1 Tax=Candidatus Enterococcus huntleyi TaxID=1857217 RepID=UPI00137B4A0F|nr:ABC transporter ATP-binding protein [Enterococcus sp. JM4C]KAF1296183.1 ABC transporter ATP-binding protein [Enterococcus sp. JM4C]
MNILTTSQLTKTYGTGDAQVHALNDVSIEIEAGEFIAIVGSSGSGKSTLLNMLGGLDTPDSGSVSVRGKDLSQLNNEELTVFRRRNIGFVFQNYNLVPILSAYENMTLPLKLDGVAVDEPYVERVTKKLAIHEKLDQLPGNLSGGQQQRVAIARALLTKPAIILADEPTGNLDSKNSLEVVSLLKSSAYEFHQTIAIVTHNEEIAQMADRMIRIEDGKVC